jgi:hypothetical protein
MAQCPFQKVSFIENAHVVSLLMAILLIFLTENDHLIKFQLIKIVFYHLIEIMLIT